MTIFEIASFFLVGVMAGVLFSVGSFALVIYFAGKITVAEITAANYIKLDVEPGDSGQTPKTGSEVEINPAGSARKAQDALAGGGALPLGGGISAANDELYRPPGRPSCKHCRMVSGFFRRHLGL